MVDTNSEKLTNPPLAEVVFELHWKLNEINKDPIFGLVDPGYFLLYDEFKQKMRKIGYKHEVSMLKVGNVPRPYQIRTRFYKRPEDAFPIIQIGPGIFATNVSKEYDWDSFKKQIENGVKILFQCYPKIKSFALEPNHIEIRYINFFDPKDLESESGDFLSFIRNETNIDISIPKYTFSHKFKKGYIGIFHLEQAVSELKNTHFILEIGNATKENIESVRLENKVVGKGDLGFNKSKEKIIINIVEWLEFAHSITSPFFKEIISKQLKNKLN